MSLHQLCKIHNQLTSVMSRTFAFKIANRRRCLMKILDLIGKRKGSKLSLLIINIIIILVITITNPGVFPESLCH